MSDKIGVVIITKDREHYFKDCLRSIDLSKIDHLVVVNDGNELSPETLEFLSSNKVHYIKNEKNLGISKTKNKGLKYLLEKSVDHIFALEDDCIIIDNNVWSEYIHAFKITNIPHFNYGPGSPWNRDQGDKKYTIGDLSKRHLSKQDGDPTPRLVVDYSDGVKIALYMHIVAMFTYFHSSILKEVGLLNEDFYNAWEHVEHTYRIIKKGKYSPFWWFADISNSHLFIKEAVGEKANSSLAKTENQFYDQVYHGLDIFRKLHNIVPGEIASASTQEVIKTLKKIKKNDNR